MNKLHLGSGGQIREGYINTDIDLLPGVDMALDASLAPYPFDDNTLDEVFSSHMIEHINKLKIPEMIREWYRVLKPGGMVVAEVPDIEGGIALYMGGKQEEALKLFYGMPEERDTQGHKWGWTYDSLAPLFEEAGFTVEHKPSQDYHLINFNIPTFRLEATK